MKTEPTPTLAAVAPATPCSPFRFVVGETYELQNGDSAKIVERFAKHRGYETVMDEHGCHRYDRSTHQCDTGRVTGTAHDYSCPLNIRRENDQIIGGIPSDGSSCSE